MPSKNKETTKSESKTKKSNSKSESGKTKKSNEHSKSSSKTTTDLEEIKQWAEERDGKPAVVKSTADSKEGGGVLRINFPGYSGEDSLEEISWDEWYETFKDRGLAFLYQEETAGGKESRFFKLINDK
jgi:hypothetical protein